ncbi:MAG: hypothetical protein ABIG20_03435 [archaeon]
MNNELFTIGILVTIVAVSGCVNKPLGEDECITHADCWYSNEGDGCMNKEYTDLYPTPEPILRLH